MSQEFKPSWMRTETLELPYLLARQAMHIQSQLQPILDKVRARGLDEVVACGRGSSAHAIAYGQALFQNYLGIRFSICPPSVASIYGLTVGFTEKSLAVFVSQSGQSPDLVKSAELARQAGILTVAFVNSTDSGLSRACEHTINIGAGSEKSVAATKSCICSMTALAHLGASWKGNSGLVFDLDRLSNVLFSSKNSKRWEGRLNGLDNWNNSLAVLGRGLTTPIALEIALKLKETCSLHAEAFSAAEFQHGPLALAGPNFACIACVPTDNAQDGLLELLERLSTLKSPIIKLEKAEGGNTSVLDPIVMLFEAYMAIETLARKRGFDPDKPDKLTKVTETV
ncbi:SIS domain-containing protein [Aquidulcibacter paucihalophilus]|uniref:SIS domain-containing protein n=1 Tax=Aquidulcibacter paucihalophilus TaxID=1978549 RepID=UPI000A18CD55|nr:SIS domain-containing protein [Aquidulcibacter paucihalophilus]